MDRAAARSLNRARALHRAGRLEEAAAAYATLLDERPRNPDLIGLLGILALQQGEPAVAAERLAQALELGGTAQTRLRILNNLIVAHRAEGNEDAIRAALSGELADWPADTPATGPDRDTVLSLVEALIGYGQPRTARKLLDQALPDRADDAAALILDGRLQLAEGAAEDAVGLLERAVALVPEDRQPLMALAHAQDQLHLTQAARASRRICDA